MSQPSTGPDALQRRSAGVLAHVTSLPGAYGIGDLGPGAIRFFDFLQETGQAWWQMLPIGPVGSYFSPYQSPSSHAGNPLLISPERLFEQGLLEERALREFRQRLEENPQARPDRVDFPTVAKLKGSMLELAYAAFRRGVDGRKGEGPASRRQRLMEVEFEEFQERQRDWLDDYALFMTLKDVYNQASWPHWPAPLADRDPTALAKWRQPPYRQERINYHKFVQYLFASQWEMIREEARRRNIGLIGDVPIYVDYDSADVWVHRDSGLFQLDGHGRCAYTAGVSPDQFSADGQHWGNPLYNWDRHREEGFAWWNRRLKSSLDRFDLVRMDHFIGFTRYYRVPSGFVTAAYGQWSDEYLPPGQPIAGQDFLRQLGEEQRRRLIAEDLGDVTEEVKAFRRELGLPGMIVLQFAFGAERNYFPFEHPENCVVYTGTHDNHTSVGWFATEAPREFVLRYLGSTGEQVHWDLIRLAYSSRARMAIIPLQDILGLDDSARMNTPGRAEGNWTWRATSEQLDCVAVRDRLGVSTALFGRWNGPVPPEYLPPDAVAGAATPAAESTPGAQESDGADESLMGAEASARPASVRARASESGNDSP